MRYGLTARQQQVYEIIRRHIDERGVPPSYDELLAETGLKGRSGIHRILTALKERGAVDWIAGRARSITILEA